MFDCCDREAGDPRRQRWVAEHSHIPVTRHFSHPLGDAALTKEYFDVMDPFVTLSAAAAVTTRLKLGTAICLLIQRDTMQTAKLAASLDQVSKGRFLFGIGCGWNVEEMEDHGTVYETRTKKMREQVVPARIDHLLGVSLYEKPCGAPGLALR
ncbi:MAG: LLM class flavin-dependent oxidoreductase [Stellaceae bacterium]